MPATTKQRCCFLGDNACPLQDCMPGGCRMRSGCSSAAECMPAARKRCCFLFDTTCPVQDCMPGGCRMQSGCNSAAECMPAARPHA
eukprot:869467-Pelagomonas_calceolata.AAC.4